MAKKKSAEPEELEEQGYCSDCGVDLAVSEMVAQKGQEEKFCDYCQENNKKAEGKKPKVVEEQLEFPMSKDDKPATSAENTFCGLVEECLIEALKPEETKQEINVVCSTTTKPGTLAYEACNAFNKEQRSSKVTQLTKKPEPENPDYINAKRVDTLLGQYHIQKLADIQKVQDAIDDLMNPEKRRIKVEKLSNKLVALQEDLQVFEGIEEKATPEMIKETMVIVKLFGPRSEKGKLREAIGILTLQELNQEYDPEEQGLIRALAEKFFRKVA